LTATVFIFGLDTVDKTPRRLYNTNIDNNLELPTMRPILIIAVLLLSGWAKPHAVAIWITIPVSNVERSGSRFLHRDLMLKFVMLEENAGDSC
jgi:hypothetical protein